MKMKLYKEHRLVDGFDKEIIAQEMTRFAKFLQVNNLKKILKS